MERLSPFDTYRSMPELCSIFYYYLLYLSFKNIVVFDLVASQYEVCRILTLLLLQNSIACKISYRYNSRNKFY